MEFVEDIRKAMLDLAMACRKNDEWDNCQYCPFKEYCNAIEAYDLGIPGNSSFLENL